MKAWNDMTHRERVMAVHEGVQAAKAVHAAVLAERAAQVGAVLQLSVDYPARGAAPGEGKTASDSRHFQGQ